MQLRISRRFLTTRPIRKVLVANRGDAAIRVMRAATELNFKTVAIFSREDRLGLHRFKADESYQLAEDASPIGAYLDIANIVRIATRHNVDAVHPGYGFLSENAEFAKAVESAGLVWVGPPPEVIEKFGDKTKARAVATACNVPVVPGTPGSVETFQEVKDFVSKHGLPVILKAAFGGGGRGMRVVTNESQLQDSFDRCRSEALTSFGNGAVFVERYVQRPRHVEVQIVGDRSGDVVHLWERDCSIQRRHQKVLEIAPANAVPMEVRRMLHRDAVALAKHVGYVNAGTVEFLTENDRHYFMEVNPRVQVEHTITEEVTGIDIVQLQLRIAAGELLKDIGIRQDDIHPIGVALQARVTTEDPQDDFRPDSGRIEGYRSPGGFGVRVDASQAFTGSVILPYYDSLLCKVTTRAPDLPGAVAKLNRALTEFRVRGVATNIEFLKKLLKNKDFLSGNITTRLLEENPDLFKYPAPSNRGQRMLSFLGHVRVNGSTTPLMQPNLRPSDVDPIVPSFDPDVAPPKGWRQVLQEKGPKGYAAALRAHKGGLLTDTTMRDAHQSLLATRVRTTDLLKIAPATAHIMAPLASLECWGGATYDVAYRFLHECPWDRLVRLREAIPNIPFQMLLRGASAVGYTNYADNVVERFCELSVKNGMDVFRIFDALNYADNLLFGIDCVAKAGGVVEAAICYTGNVNHPRDGRYSLDYYLKLARRLKEHGTHILGIKDMAGVLTPAGARTLITALRKEFPDLAIHVHTHDTAGVGVATQIAALESGADVVDCALDSMSGMTSQPSMGAIVAALSESQYDTGMNISEIQSLNSYWEIARGLYAPFESNQKSGNSDVMRNEIPGGQYTNLQFQAHSLGLAAQWPQIKVAYEQANILLGDIVKVTPTSKVVGDLAQFMVQNNLSLEECEAKAASLNFPSSVIEYLKGFIGQPPFGYREPFRSRALRLNPATPGSPTSKELEAAGCMLERPGLKLPPFDFAALEAKLSKKWGYHPSDVDVISAVLFPDVFDEYMTFLRKFGKVWYVPTRQFLGSMRDGESVSLELQEGKTVPIRLLGCSNDVDNEGNRRVFFELNGMPRTVFVPDHSDKTSHTVREKADASNEKHIGAPMRGLVIEVRVVPGESVKEGAPLLILSAMKMEMIIAAPCDCVVGRIAATKGENVNAGDLLLSLA